MTEDERKRIDAALTHAQMGTTAVIAVRIITDAHVDALEHAKAEFTAKGLHQSAGENGALILVAPKAKRFAVIGDRALHERVGQKFWDDTVAQMAKTFKSGKTADAIVQGIDRLGRAFHEHFKA